MATAAERARRYRQRQRRGLARVYIDVDEAATIGTARLLGWIQEHEPDTEGAVAKLAERLLAALNEAAANGVTLALDDIR